MTACSDFGAQRVVVGVQTPCTCCWCSATSLSLSRTHIRCVPTRSYKLAEQISIAQFKQAVASSGVPGGMALGGHEEVTRLVTAHRLVVDLVHLLSDSDAKVHPNALCCFCCWFRLLVQFPELPSLIEAASG